MSHVADIMWGNIQFLKKLFKLIHVHLYIAKFIISGGQQEKQRKTMKRIVHQTLKNYNFIKINYFEDFRTLTDF